MRVVVGPRGRRFSTNGTRVRFLPRMSFHVVGKIVASREPFAAIGAFEISYSGMLGNVPLPIGLVGKLKAALVTNKRLQTFMRPNVGVQLRLSDVGLAAHLTFERPRSETFMLVLVVFQVVLGNEPHFTNITSVGFQALMLDSDMLVNAGLVKHL